MTNIDRNLTSSTLIDGAKVSSLEKAYVRMYKIGVSIRLCEYDEGKQCHVSMFGPRVAGGGHSKRKHVLGNRPLTSNKRKGDCYDMQEQPCPVVKSGIDAWIANIPDAGSVGSVSVDDPAGHSFDAEQDTLEYHSWVTSDAAASDRLIDIGPPSTCTGDLLADKGDEREELKKLKKLKLEDSKELKHIDERQEIKPSTALKDLLDLEDQNLVVCDLIDLDGPKSSCKLAAIRYLTSILISFPSPPGYGSLQKAWQSFCQTFTDNEPAGRESQASRHGSPRS